MRFSGKLTTWQDERGFGFISLTQGGEEIFLHIKMFPRQGGRPQVGEILTFDIVPGPQGKRRAINVQRAGVGRPPQRAGRSAAVSLRTRISGLLAVAAGLGVYWICDLVWGVPAPLALACLWCLALSLVAFAVYGVDKAAAGSSGRRRVSEAMLHLLAVAGGWPGAWLAQQLLHHKRAKPAFMRVYYLTVLLHVAAFGALAAWWAQGGAAWPH